MIVNSNRFNFKDSIDDLLVNWYENDVVPTLEETLDEVSKEAVKKLKKASPGKGDYHKGWTREREKGRIKVGWTIYNKLPGLPHLLENSHALRNGLRSTPIVHIQPVEQWAIEEVQDRFYDKMEGV